MRSEGRQTVEGLAIRNLRGHITYRRSRWSARSLGL